MYEWLLDYQQLMQKIEYLEYKLEREKRELGRWSGGDLGGKILHEKSISSGLEERIEAMEYELAHVMNELFNARKLIAAFKGIENKILFYKYVEGMTLEEIAECLKYSSSHIYKKHAEIMKRIKFVNELNSHFSFPK